MNQWMVLYRKEMLEMGRNYKWLWVPLVFILLGLMNPVTAYYTPQLLEANGLSAEVIKSLPVPTGTEVMAKALGQYGTLGMLILVLSFMGTVAGERLHGSATLVLVKPVSRLTYITSKWAGMMTLTIVSFVLGYAATWYYTDILIGAVPFDRIWQSLLLYSVWLLFMTTVTLFFSCLLLSSGGIAFLSLLTAAALTLITGLLGRYMKWSPGRLSGEASHLLNSGQAGTGLWLPLVVTALLAALLIYGAAAYAQRKWNA
jgi:ABC-2 type transport system permease protein